MTLGKTGYTGKQGYAKPFSKVLKTSDVILCWIGIGTISGV